MELRTLRYFEVIARLGNITRASEVLHVAQPALSVAIRKLEEELEVNLFDRQQNRRVTLTAAGEILLKYVYRLLHEVDSARRELADATELRSGEVKVGMPPMYGPQFFRPLARAFHEAHPGIRLRATTGSAGEVSRMLDAGEIDLAVLEERRVNDSWHSALVGSEEVVLAIRRDHALARKKRVVATDLDELPMAVFDRTFLQRNVLDDRFTGRNATYRTAVESNDVNIVIASVRDGLGAATLLRSMIERDGEIVGVAFDPPEVFAFHLCWIKTRYVSRANQAFVDLALARSKEQLTHKRR